jgi:integrase
MARRGQRNPRGAGTVYERADRPGTWVTEVTVGGKRRREHYSSKELARAALERLVKGAADQPRPESLGAWLSRWAETIAPKRVESKTAQTYASIIRNQWLRHGVSNVPIASVEPEQIEDALADMMASGLSRTTVGHARAVLSAAYTGAIREKLVIANPVPGARLPGRPTTPRVRQMRFSEAVYRQISDAVAEHPVRPFVELIARTGLRPGEVLALKWGDIALADRVIYVRRAVKQVGTGWVVGPPKTALSVRDVPLPDELRPILFQLRDRQHKPPEDAWVFPSPFSPDQPDNPVRMAKACRPIFDAAGLSGWTPRDLRSLHASILLGQNVDVVTVSRRLGPSDPTTTFRRYAGVVTGTDRRAADGMRMWGRPRRPKAGDSEHDHVDDAPVKSPTKKRAPGASHAAGEREASAIR